ncbi:MAG: T9SS type A sorting domain-containing protein [Lishizhenia sp.]
MKSILLFFSVATLISTKAQSTLIFINDTIESSYGTSYAEHQGYFYNESGINDTLITQYELISSPSDWSFSFCVGFICLTSNSNYFESNLNSADSVKIKGVWNPGSSGIGVVKFTSYLKNELDTTISYLYLSVGSLGITDVGSDIKTNIFPNPAKEEITISADQDILAVKLFDMQGKEHPIFGKVKENQFKVNISNIESGSYTVLITAQDGSATSRLIVL